MNEWRGNCGGFSYSFSSLIGTEGHLAGGKGGLAGGIVIEEEQSAELDATGGAFVGSLLALEDHGATFIDALKEEEEDLEHFEEKLNNSYRRSLSEGNVEEVHKVSHVFEDRVKLVLEEADTVRTQGSVVDLDGQLDVLGTSEVNEAQDQESSQNDLHGGEFCGQFGEVLPFYTSEQVITIVFATKR